MEYDIEKISNKINNKRVTKKIFKYIILSILLIFFVFNMILSFEEKTHFFGINIFNIVSGSMQPTLNINDLVVVQKCSISKLRKGDIITFAQDGRTISHRIVDIIQEKGKLKFKTKGDNNEIPDLDKVEPSQIYGKVIFSIKKIGKIVDYIQNIRGFINIAILAVIIYIFASLRDKQKSNRKMKRKKYETKKMRDNYHEK